MSASEPTAIAPLRGIHPEQLRRAGRDDVDPALAGDAALDHAAVVQQVDAVLDPRQAVRNLPEVAPPELLLALEVERAVVGRDDLEVVLDEARPQLLPVRVLLAQGRRAHELRALEPVAQVVEAEEQVLGTRLGERLHPAIPGATDRIERILRRQVDDVDRDAGGLGEPDHAVGRLALEDRVARDAVVVGIGLAVGDQLCRDHVDRGPVLGVHHDQPAVPGGLLHRAVDVVVGAVEHAGVRGEQLEVRDALGDERVHLGQRLVVDVAHDHVEPVVDDGVALRLRVPRVEARAEARTAALHGEVDDRRRPAEGGGPRARLERVLRGRAAERELHVGVDVDRPRDHVLAGGVDRLVDGDACERAQRALGKPPDRRDRLPVDEHVGDVRPVGRDDGAVGDQGAHRASSRSRYAGQRPAGRSTWRQSYRGGAASGTVTRGTRPTGVPARRCRAGRRAIGGALGRRWVGRRAG